MNYTLACDACDLEESYEDQTAAYAGARDHEDENPTHNVLIRSNDAATR
jgi:hypothetical protein